MAMPGRAPLLPASGLVDGVFVESETEFVLNETERVRLKGGTTFKNGTRDDGTLVADEVEFLTTAP